MQGGMTQLQGWLLLVGLVASTIGAGMFVGGMRSELQTANRTLLRIEEKFDAKFADHEERLRNLESSRWRRGQQ